MDDINVKILQQGFGIKLVSPTEPEQGLYAGPTEVCWS